MPPAITVHRSCVIWVLGDTCSGKSSLCTRSKGMGFTEEYDRTATLSRWSASVGKAKRLTVLESPQKCFRHPPCPRERTGILLVFDLTSRGTFERLPVFLDGAPEDCCMTLVGSKRDLVDADEAAREVTHAEATALAERLGCSYVEVSAKTDDVRSIRLLFGDLARRVMTRGRVVLTLDEIEACDSDTLNVVFTDMGGSTVEVMAKAGCGLRQVRAQLWEQHGIKRSRLISSDGSSLQKDEDLERAGIAFGAALMAPPPSKEECSGEGAEAGATAASNHSEEPEAAPPLPEERSSTLVDLALAAVETGHCEELPRCEDVTLEAEEAEWLQRASRVTGVQAYEEGAVEADAAVAAAAIAHDAAASSVL